VARLRVPTWPVLVDVEAADGRVLQGLAYGPDGGGDAVAAILHLHGRGGNCYSGPGRVLPQLLADEPVVHLALNLRSHDLGYTRYDIEDGGELRDEAVTVDGGYWERLDTGRTDAEAGVAWLRAATGLPVVISGHSAGGFVVADHSAGDPPVAGRILLSPLTTTRHPLAAWFGGGDALRRAVEQAHDMVAAGDGHLLIPVRRWFFAISAGTLLDRLAEEEGRWVDGMNGSDAPVLLAWGDREDRATHWRAIARALRARDTRVLELEGTGHVYQGRERELATAVAAFVHDVAVAA
jgi:hypothetical protein